MAKASEENLIKDKDIFRDTPIRLLGYANEVGEAFRAIIRPKMIMVSYGIATAYVLADTGSKTFEAYNDKTIKHNHLKKIVYVATDTLVWQMLASVVVPGLTINRACALTNFIIKKNQLITVSVRKWIVTGIGLAIIPFIIKPIDHLVDSALDVTLRKLMP